MRELRVVGLERDTGMVIVADEQAGEKFRIPADDRLRAAARGDITRLGQIEIEMESALRPREIQSRIRAGATVAQVAAAAGVSPEKVERFAHPVLLERARAAELAGAAHPIAIDGPTSATLAEVVAGALGSADYGDDSVWDAWKGDDGYWIVQVGWRVAGAEHYAHWRYLPGSHAGTVEPLDEAADELTDPDYSRPLRGLEDKPAGRHALPTAVPVDQTTEEPATLELPPVMPEPELPHPEPMTPAAEAPEREAVDPEPEALEPEPKALAPEPEPVEQPPVDKPAKQRRGRSKPAVPAWEDVLLGVRSSGDN